MASGIDVQSQTQAEQEHQRQQTAPGGAGGNRSQLVQRLLDASANLPQFVHDLIQTQAVTVAGTGPSCIGAVHGVFCPVRSPNVPVGAVQAYATTHWIDEVATAETFDTLPTSTVHGSQAAFTVNSCGFGAGGAGGGVGGGGGGGGTWRRGAQPMRTW